MGGTAAAVSPLAVREVQEDHSEGPPGAPLVTFPAQGKSRPAGETAWNQGSSRIILQHFIKAASRRRQR